MIPVEIINPSTGYKIPKILYKFRKRVPEFNLEEISKRLKEIRNYTTDHLDSLLQQLKKTLERYQGVDLIYARDAKDVVTVLKRICGTSKKISVNKSNTVEELRELLLEEGFEIEDTYFKEFEGFVAVNERRPYWQAPEVTPEVKWRSFIPIPFGWEGKEGRAKVEKNKVILFGVNAISADDATVFFLEHSRNITRGLREASHIVFLVGLEKVVKNREDALFQTLCTGLFGFEGISSELKLQSAKQDPSVKDCQQDKNPQISIILLDNGRDATRENFKELLWCIGCRTCNAVCPSFFAYERVFEGPRNLIRMFNEVFEAGKVAPGKETVWACRTCKLCEERCPLEIRHIDKFVKMRERLIEGGKIAPTLRDALESTFLHGNPWRRAKDKRDEWAGGEVERFKGHGILYYVGCTPSYDTECQKIAKSLSRIFKMVGVSFGILGTEEKCCGAEIRRIGETGLFEELAKQNEQLFKKAGVKKIVTTSPHCFNTFKNEYNGKFEVLHYTQFLIDLLDKLEFKKALNCEVTYQDPCYLGRHNQIYEEPRKILKALPGVKLVEMEPNMGNSFCCGGGGGHMWFDWPRRPRPSEIRVKHAIDTGANTLAVACPFCLITFDDAIKSLGYEDKIKVKDISTLVIEAMG
ncbi:MAG: heterodisulfide reductase-related iron-sulfur binding cluster [Candidatus Thermoplasmatota archaeon]